MKRRLTVNLHQSTWDDLERYAEQDGWTLREEVEFILRTYEPPTDLSEEPA